MRYQQIFDQAIGATPPAAVDVDRVVRQQRRAARTRPALAAVAVGLVAAGSTVGAVELGGDGDSPWVPAGPLAGFPEYAKGARVVAAESAPMSGRSITLTFTPTTLDLVLFTRCDDHELDDDPDIGLQAELSVGELTVVDVPYCLVDDETAWVSGGTDSWDFCVGDVAPEGCPTPAEKFWAAAGIAIGEPVTITFRLTGVHAIGTDDSGGRPPLPSEGTLALAIGERVPFEEYQLPQRPAELAPLEEMGADAELRSDPADPNGPVEATLSLAESDVDRLAGCPADSPGSFGPVVLLDSQTPGSLRVLINDIEVAHQTWWDYEQIGVISGLDEACADLDWGEEVTIRVEPEHMSGDWQVLLSGL